MPDRAPITVEVVDPLSVSHSWVPLLREMQLVPGSLDEAIYRLGLAEASADAAFRVWKDGGSPRSGPKWSALLKADKDQDAALAEVYRMREAGNV